MNRLDKLESKAIYILREAYSEFNNLGMLWSVGKDSTVMLWLARKAFCNHVPFPLIQIDTGYQPQEMLDYRDKITKEWKLDMIIGQNRVALANKNTFPEGKLNRIHCCKKLKTQALKNTVNGNWKRLRYDHKKDKFVEDKNRNEFHAVIAGIRADEEGTRSKERYFSPRNKNNSWDIEGQPPELWDQFKTEFKPDTHVRIHPILDWTELDIWKYIERENIPFVSLYKSKNGKRNRSLGCKPCTNPIESDAKTIKEIVKELESGKLKNIAERSGRAQDKEDGGTLEELRKEGYM